MPVYFAQHRQEGCTLTVTERDRRRASDDRPAVVGRFTAQACLVDVHNPRMGDLRQEYVAPDSMKSSVRAAAEQFVYDHALAGWRQGADVENFGVEVHQSTSTLPFARELGAITVASATQAVIERKVYDEAVREYDVRAAAEQAVADQAHMAATMDGAAPLPFAPAHIDQPAGPLQ